jgi:hypothetical protein
MVGGFNRSVSLMMSSMYGSAFTSSWSLSCEMILSRCECSLRCTCLCLASMKNNAFAKAFSVISLILLAHFLFTDRVHRSSGDNGASVVIR